MERARIGTGQIEGYSESDAQKLVDFFSLQSNTCRSFKFPVDKDMDNAVDECSKQIAARTAYAVWLAACSGDADSCLELGMRMYAGCGASQDRDAALDWWRRISDPTYPSFIKSSSRPLKARALACLANAYYEKCCLPNQTLQIDDLYRAAQLANAAASWGLTSPIVLSVGNRVEKFGLRRQADCQFKGVDTSRFEAFEFLWKVVDARSEQLKKVREKRDAKVLQAPNLYVCAREGCGIEGTSRSALQQCSGKCPLDAKPSYCSRECQKADWKRHRIVCIGARKADSKDETPPPKRSSRTFAMRSDGRELNIEVPLPGVPGKKIQVSSTTMSTSLMKEFRDRAEEEVGRR